jgi:hypothetical protein
VLPLRIHQMEVELSQPLRRAERGGMRGRVSQLGDVASELEAVDREVAVGVGGGDQAGGFTCRPGVSPEIWSAIGACKYASHALARGVVGTGPGGKVGDYLLNVCRARSKGGQQPTPVIELVLNGTGEGDVVARAF